MTAEKLYENVLATGEEIIAGFTLSDLHKAMLMECCDNVVNAKSDEPISDEMLVLVAVRTLEVCNGLIKGLIAGAVTELGGDIVNLNYRGQEFRFNRSSPFVKMAIEENNQKRSLEKAGE